MTSYAYLHARPGTIEASGIFYVGKGLLKRALSVYGRNKHHQNVVAKHGAENILIGKIECSSEETAFDLEKGLIKCLRRMGVLLTNQTDGGEGTVGIVPSAESNAKRSAALKGIPLQPGHSEKIRIALVGRPHTTVSKENMSTGQINRYSNMSKEELMRLTEGLRTHVRSSEEIERRSVALKAAAAKRKSIKESKENNHG